ncbi:hypothetical protein F4779DRAFT_636995 [Xylariaceae sp. FL0662B]|nr:hypothetical protein F4779DRAFT_636995 [Xylariaceae sp. FL0662B]
MASIKNLPQSQGIAINANGKRRRGSDDYKDDCGAGSHKAVKLSHPGVGETKPNPPSPPSESLHSCIQRLQELQQRARLAEKYTHAPKGANIGLHWSSQKERHISYKKDHIHGHIRPRRMMDDLWDRMDREERDERLARMRPANEEDEEDDEDDEEDDDDDEGGNDNDDEKDNERRRR